MWKQKGYGQILKTKIKQTLCERESELSGLTCSKSGCVCVTQTLDNLNVEKELHVFLLQVDCRALSRHGNAHTSNDGQAGAWEAVLHCSVSLVYLDTLL